MENYYDELLNVTLDQTENDQVKTNILIIFSNIVKLNEEKYLRRF